MTPMTDKAWSDPSSGRLMDVDWGGNVIHQAKVSRDLELELLEMTKFRDLLAIKEAELLSQLRGFKLALSRCETAIRSVLENDSITEIEEAINKALDEISKLKEH